MLVEWVEIGDTGKEPGGTLEIEQFSLTEIANLAIPEPLGVIRQVCSQQALVVDLGVRKLTLPEHFEEGIVIQVPDGGNLQFQQGVLARVHIDTVDMSRLVEYVIQRVASRRRDHQYLIIRLNGQRLAIAAGIFPAGVVDKISLSGPA